MTTHYQSGNIPTSVCGEFGELTTVLDLVTCTACKREQEVWEEYFDE